MAINDRKNSILWIINEFQSLNVTFQAIGSNYLLFSYLILKTFWVIFVTIVFHSKAIQRAMAYNRQVYKREVEAAEKAESNVNPTYDTKIFGHHHDKHTTTSAPGMYISDNVPCIFKSLKHCYENSPILIEMWQMKKELQRPQRRQNRYLKKLRRS